MMGKEIKCRTTTVGVASYDRPSNEPHARSQDRERFAALRFGVFPAGDTKPLNGPPSELFLTQGTANYNEDGTSYPSTLLPKTDPFDSAARKSRA